MAKKARKILIVLGTAYKKTQLTPRPLLRARLDRAIKAIRTKKYDQVIVCGGFTYSKYFPSESEIMRHYLIRRRINPRMIILEDWSNNTIGNFIFTKTKILEPRGWKDVTIITNNIYVPRAKYIESKIFGKDYTVNFIGCKNNMRPNFRRWTMVSEKFWLNVCYPPFFKGINPGNDGKILKRLEQKDDYYPKDYREMYRKLKFKHHVPPRKRIKQAKKIKEVG